MNGVIAPRFFNYQAAPVYLTDFVMYIAPGRLTPAYRGLVTLFPLFGNSSMNRVNGAFIGKEAQSHVRP
jgi:hypothetical protein